MISQQIHIVILTIQMHLEKSYSRTNQLSPWLLFSFLRLLQQKSKILASNTVEWTQMISKSEQKNNPNNIYGKISSNCFHL